MEGGESGGGRETVVEFVLYLLVSVSLLFCYSPV